MPFAILDTAMTLWMLVDAIKRRADAYWYLIILMPVGQWIYFFAVKIHDYDLAQMRKRLFDRPPSLKQLRLDFEETPSAENKVRLAQGLFDAQEYAEAAELFTEVLERDDNDREARYGLALCQINMNELSSACARLRRLIDMEPAHADYEPWFDLAYAHWRAEERDEAVNVLERLVESAPRLKHKAVLGKYLARAGEPERAREVLESMLRDYRNATSFVRRHAGRWVRDARATLREIERARE